jgi:hypothetical protein
VKLIIAIVSRAVSALKAESFKQILPLSSLAVTRKEE